MRNLYYSVAFCLFLCVATVGCGGPEGPTLVPVSGKILLDGEPVAGAWVRFVQGTGPASGGETNAQGEFTLIGPGNRPGAIVGSFTVTVGCPYNPSQGSSPDGSTGTPADTSKCNLPLKYSDVSTSDVNTDVSEQGAPSLVIELTSK